MKGRGERCQLRAQLGIESQGAIKHSPIKHLLRFENPGAGERRGEMARLIRSQNRNPWEIKH